MGVVLKLAILIYCIKHVMDKGEPAKTALLYSSLFLVIGIILGLLAQFNFAYGVIIGITFAYDLLTGFIFFWLINRFQDNLFLFYLIIFLAILSSFAIKFAINFAFGMPS